MAVHELGRTNRGFPPLWLRLLAPSASDRTDPEALIRSAIEYGAPLDVSSGPALWGGYMRGLDDVLILQNSSVDLERATDASHAASLVQAHLIETLSALGRLHVDLYFLRSRVAFSESQICGALEALEGARDEGHVRFFGLRAEGDPAWTTSNWTVHDAFELLSVEADNPSHDDLLPMARSRRVGVLRRVPTARSMGVDPPSSIRPILVPVSSASEVGALRSVELGETA